MTTPFVIQDSQVSIDDTANESRTHTIDKNGRRSNQDFAECLESV